MAHKEIKVSEYYSKLIANLPTRPNASPGDFSGGGLSAIQLKQAFDAVPLFIIDRLNGLIQYINEISDEGLSAYILEAIKSNIADSVDTGISLNIQTLSDLFDAIKSGDLSKVLTVESRGESLDAVVTSLFSGITETIDKEIEAAKASGKFDLVSVTHEWYGSVLALTSASGTTYTDLRGPQGPQGEGFKISRTYSSIAAMNNGFSHDDVPENGFVIINTGFVNDEDNAKLFIKGKTQYNYLTDLSGAQGIKGERGDPGRGIVSITLEKEDGKQKQYKVTYTEGPPYYFIVTNGSDGVSATHSWNGTTLTVTSASGTSSRDLKGEKGDKGDPGERGEGFRIQETYKSFSDMEAASLTDGVPAGGFVLISTDDVEDPDNAKLYVKTSTGAYKFLTDLSGAQGIQGVGIDRIEALDGDPPEDQYRIHFTNGKYFDYSIKHGESIRVSETTESTESGGKNVVEFSDGKKITIRNGRDGRNGIDGDSLTITKIEQSDKAGGVSVITFSDAGKKLEIKNGYNGEDGSSVGIDIITTSDEDGGINAVTFTDSSMLQIRNGSKGSSVEVDYINESNESGGKNIVGLKDKNGNHELQVSNGKDGSSVVVDYINESNESDGSNIVVLRDKYGEHELIIRNGKQGGRGPVGPSGPQGPQGEGFKVSRTFVSLDDMFASYGHDDEVPDYGFVLIQSPRGAEDPDNAKLYVKNPELGYVYLTDLSGAQGIKGDTGNGIKSIYETGDDGPGKHYLYIEYTNGGGEYFEIFDGPQGPQGSPGKDGSSVVVYEVTENSESGGYNTVVLQDKNGNHELYVRNGKDGARGDKGEKGRGISQIYDSTNTEGQHYITIVYTDGESAQFELPEGKDGERGPAGPAGPAGPTGPQGPGKFNVELGTTTFADIVEAYQENNVVTLDYGGIIMPLVAVSVEDKVCLFLVSEPGAALGVMIDAYGNVEEINIPYVMAEDLAAHAKNEHDAKHLTEYQLGIVAELPKIVQDDVDKWDFAYDAVGNKLDKSARGAANGVASLDSSGKVPPSQLPSYVDDVLEYSEKTSFPGTGVSGKIYVDQSDNKTYRWGGSAYVEISASLALGENESTAYPGNLGKDAHDLASAANAALANKVDKETGKGLSTNDYTTAEKNKLAGIAEGAEANVQSDWNATSGDAFIRNKPTIPTKTSQLTNDSGFRTTDANTEYSFTATSNALEFNVQGSDDIDNKQTVTLKKPSYNLGEITDTNSYVRMTAAERTKLSGIAENANNYSHPSTHDASMITGLATVAKSGEYSDLKNPPIDIEGREAGDHAVINAPYAVLKNGSTEKLLATTDQIPEAVTVDSALSSTSTNPVQNKVINAALAEKSDSHNHPYLPLSGGTLDTNAKIKLSTYGTRFLTLSGNSIDADMSNETGGWAGNFASVKAPGGATTTMLGWYGGASGLTHIFMGGSYSDPAMKMTPAGQFTFKNVPKVGSKDIATTDQIPSVAGLASTSYVDQKVAGIVDSSPEALNTLNELAAALGDDPNFATTVSTNIGKKVDKTTTVNGHALSGNVTVSKSDVGLGNVANERQYSANNPPPYPVTSVAGRTGAVTLKYSDLSDAPVSVVEEGGNDVAVIGAPYAKLNDGNFLVTEDGVKDEVESIAALKSEGIFYIEGTGSTVGKWFGASTRFTAPYDGLAIRYKIPVNGSTTTTLNINDTGDVDVYRFNDTKLTTHFEAGMIVNLIYHENYQGEGTSRWMCSDYDSNTNTYLRVYRRTNTTSNQSTYGKDFPLLVSNTEASKIGTAGSNNTYAAVYGVMWDDTAKVPTLNPVTGEMKAVKFTGTFNGNATSATSATKATQDASGNVITSTYAKKSELPTSTEKDNWDSAVDNASAALTKAEAALTKANNALPKAGGTMDASAAIKWPTKNSLNPFVGYCTASSDGTFLIGSLEGTVWNTGLAIGGSSKNLLWKGAKVAVATDIGNGTLTIKKNGIQAGTFSANQSSNVTINIDAPISLDQTGENDTAVIGADYARLSNGARLVDGNEFDDYVESQTPRAVIENKGFILVEKASAPTGFTISNGTTAAGTLSLRIEEDEYDSSFCNAYAMQLDVNGNEFTAWSSTSGDPPHVNWIKQNAKYAGKYNLRFNFSQKGTISNDLNRVNEILIYVNGTITEIHTCSIGTNFTSTAINVSAGAEIKCVFYASINGNHTMSDDYSVTLSNICFSCEKAAQSVTNNSTLRPSYARAVIAATSTTQTVRASYYESLNATLEKFRQAIIALGGTV